MMTQDKPAINRGKRSVYIPEPLWGRVRQAAGETGAREGRPVRDDLSVLKDDLHAARAELKHDLSVLKDDVHESERTVQNTIWKAVAFLGTLIIVATAVLGLVLKLP